MSEKKALLRLMSERKALLSFAKWVAKEIFRENFDGEVFAELACRKLNAIGIVKTDGEHWIYEGEDECTQSE